MTRTWNGWTHVRFVFRRVKWPSWAEGEDWGQITGGQIELSTFSDLKATGTLTFEGVEVPDDNDLVRIYYSYIDSSGTFTFSPLATMIFSAPQPAYDGMTISGTLDCQSVLFILSAKKYGAPFTIPAGTKAVQRAIELVESLGLRVNNPDPSAYVVNTDYTFTESEANYLTIVNWLLGAAGYSSAWVDAYGVIQMTPYVEPLERPASIILADDESSIMYPEVTRRSDYSDTPNVVRLLYETEAESLVASATNIDPDSKASLITRKYEVTYSESISELSGDTAEERLANLKTLALQKLVDKSSNIEYVEGKCQYDERIAPNNAIVIDYVRAGINWSGALTNATVRLELGMPTEFSARRFLRSGFKTETAGSILWQAEVSQ